MFTSFFCWLHDWQELLGAIIGAALGAGMGFFGAWYVARDVRQTERRAAVRVVVIDVVGFKEFADKIEEARESLMITPPQYPQWLLAQLQAYFYPVSPMFERQLPKLFGDSKSDLVAHLMAFNKHYREVGTRLATFSMPGVGTSAADVEKAYTQASQAADRAADKLTPEYLAMYDAYRSKA